MDEETEKIMDTGQEYEEETDGTMDDRNDYMTVCENVIEFVRGQKTATATLVKGRLQNRLRNAVEAHPDEAEIVTENQDGSIVAHIPSSWVDIRPPRKREMTEEERLEMNKRMERMRMLAREKNMKKIKK